MTSTTQENILVLATGPLTLYQDRGRPGFGHVGVSPSGAADHSSHDAANRLVGNKTTSATLEVMLGGLILRANASQMVAVTGAGLPLDVTSATGVIHRQSMGTLFHLAAGNTLSLGTGDYGLRSYLAVRGGFVPKAELGSRSRDVLSGLGPAPIIKGDRLPVGSEALGWPATDSIPHDARQAPFAQLEAWPGPRDDWFAPSALTILTEQFWTVDERSNRIGVRLAGDAGLERRTARELPSEGTVTGSIQIPADGKPVLFLRDHPVTGGYPVVAVLTARSIDLAAQLRPGDTVRLRLLSQTLI